MAKRIFIVITAAALASVAITLLQGRGGASPAPGAEEASRRPEVAVGVSPHLGEALNEQGLFLGDPVFMRIFKEEHELELFVRHRESGEFRLFKTYPVANWGEGTLGPKLKEGDGQAPEGFYDVPKSSMNPESSFHLSFNLGFPNTFDRHHGRSGSFLMVHGSTVSIGCYAMTDPYIEEIYTVADAALDGGQPFFPVHCFPFRMTDGRMMEAENEGGHWLQFWKNLATGYRLFEVDGIPPAVSVDRDSGAYTFTAP